MANDINSYIKDIIECMTQQNRLIVELIEIGEKQVEALKIDDLHELNDVTQNQENNGRNLALLEKKRREIVNEIEIFLGKEDIKMTDVIAIASDGNKKLLQELVDNLVNNQLKLQETHELSRLLLKQSLQYVHRMMDCIDPNRKKTYGSSGQIERSETINSVNRSV